MAKKVEMTEVRVTVCLKPDSACALIDLQTQEVKYLTKKDMEDLAGAASKYQERFEEIRGDADDDVLMYVEEYACYTKEQVKIVAQSARITTEEAEAFLSHYIQTRTSGW